jgi:hypothetical protein
MLPVFLLSSLFTRGSSTTSWYGRGPSESKEFRDGSQVNEIFQTSVQACKAVLNSYHSLSKIRRLATVGRTPRFHIKTLNARGREPKNPSDHDGGRGRAFPKAEVMIHESSLPMSNSDECAPFFGPRPNFPLFGRMLFASWLVSSSCQSHV